MYDLTLSTAEDVIMHKDEGRQKQNFPAYDMNPPKERPGHLEEDISAENV